MNTAFKKTTCRLLVVPLLALTFQSAHAGLIGADQVAGPQPSSERALVLSTLAWTLATALRRRLAANGLSAPRKSRRG